MSVRYNEKRNYYEVRYRYNGKRHYVGSYPNEKIAKVAERTHKAKLKQLEGLNVGNAPVELIAPNNHMPWRPNEELNIFTQSFDVVRNRFKTYVHNRRVQRALEKQTEQKLRVMDAEPIKTIFNK